jgi:hypothetical protein
LGFLFAQEFPCRTVNEKFTGVKINPVKFDSVTPLSIQGTPVNYSIRPRRTRVKKK